MSNEGITFGNEVIALLTNPQNKSEKKERKKLLAKLYKQPSLWESIQKLVLDKFTTEPHNVSRNSDDSDSASLPPRESDLSSEDENFHDASTFPLDINMAAVPLDRAFINDRALHQLMQIPVFNGHPAMRFGNWIRHLDNVLAPTQWEDAGKIRALSDRLRDSAFDVFMSIRNPGDTYEQIKTKLNNRYHGHETAAYYQKAFEERVRKPGETISDFAYDLRKLINRAYTHLNTEELRYPLLKRAFIKGISSRLRSVLVNQTFTTYEELVERAITIDANHIADYEDESPKPSFVKSIQDSDNAILNKLSELTTSIAALNMHNNQPNNRFNGNQSGSYRNSQNRYRNVGNGHSRSYKRCGFCGKPGHTDQECFALHPERKNNQNNGPNRVACTFCKSTQHIGKSCPQNPLKSNAGNQDNQGN